MTRFNEITIDAVAATVKVGSGLTWDQVYAALEPYGVNVVGARVPGIGVAGLTLGGGESVLSFNGSTSHDAKTTRRLLLEEQSIWSHD
jgi:FAD/FMN-containing dehydrogenase